MWMEGPFLEEERTFPRFSFQPQLEQAQAIISVRAWAHMATWAAR